MPNILQFLNLTQFYGHFILPNPPKDTIKCIEKMMYNFIWDGKPDKIKREILTSDYDKGGLRMIDIEKFIWSLKISWVKRILQTESNSLLKHLYENVFKQFGGNILFECNFREADIIKHFNKKPFLRDLLLAWSKFANKTVVPTNQFLTKCNIVGSALCKFCSMEIETVSHLFWE